MRCEKLVPEDKAPQTGLEKAGLGWRTCLFRMLTKMTTRFLRNWRVIYKISEIDFWTDENIPPAEKWISEIEANSSQLLRLLWLVTKKLNWSWLDTFWGAYALGMQTKVIVIKIEKITLPDPLPFIQNISKPQSPLEWNQLIQVLRKHRNETWLRYWYLIKPQR